MACARLCYNLCPGHNVTHLIGMRCVVDLMGHQTTWIYPHIMVRSTWDIIMRPMLESVHNSGLENLIRRTPYQSGLRCQAEAAKASHEKLEFRAMGFEEKKCIYICVAAITTKNLNIDFKKLKIPDAERESVCVCVCV